MSHSAFPGEQCARPWFAAGWAGWRLICRIRPISLILSTLLPAPLLQPRGSELLCVAALGNKLSLQSRYLLVEQIVCLVNQAECRVGNHRRVAGIEPARVALPMMRIWASSAPKGSSNSSTSGL